MAATSDDVIVRCKACGREVADVTIRRTDDTSGNQAMRSIRWALGLVRCGRCMDAQAEHRR